MNNNKRVIIIVLDSVGIGELPDAAKYGDVGSNTLKHIYENTEGFALPNMEEMGLTSIDGTGLSKPIKPIAAYCKMAEVSPGKDTTTGHWELAGLQLNTPFNVFPDGFGQDIITKFKESTGYDILCNKPASGTEVIKEYGIEHINTRKLIVYTSADSVFQIAAHEKVIPLNELYDICAKTRIILNDYNVGRVIARPFIGDSPENFKRTSNRRDFSMLPNGVTLLDNIKSEGKEVAAVGKIEDIFAAQGITTSVHTTGNIDGINKTLEYMDSVNDGLIFANLVDFDMLFGHRNDINGYANALMEFDRHLPEITDKMRDEDILFITADHGCDPTTSSTDHSREYVPLLIYGKNIKPVNLGIRDTFSDLAATAAEYLNIAPVSHGTSFLKEIL